MKKIIILSMVMSMIFGYVPTGYAEEINFDNVSGLPLIYAPDNRISTVVMELDPDNDEEAYYAAAYALLSPRASVKGFIVKSQSDKMAKFVNAIDSNVKVYSDASEIEDAYTYTVRDGNIYDGTNQEYSSSGKTVSNSLLKNNNGELGKWLYDEYNSQGDLKLKNIDALSRITMQPYGKYDYAAEDLMSLIHIYDGTEYNDYHTSKINEIIPGNKPKVIVNADCCNEIDDEFAVLHAALRDEFDIKAFVGTQHHGGPLVNIKGYLPNLEMYELPTNTATIAYKEMRLMWDYMGAEYDYEKAKHLKSITYQGSNAPLTKSSSYYVSTEECAELDGAEAILENMEQATESDPLYIMILGAFTDVARAIDLAEMRNSDVDYSNIVVICSAGGGQNSDFNKNQDIDAFIKVCNKLETWHIASDKYGDSYALESELIAKFGKKSKLGNMLCGNLKRFMEQEKSGTWPAGNGYTFGDSPVVAALLNHISGTDIFTYKQYKFTEDTTKSIGYYLTEDANGSVKKCESINGREVIYDMFDAYDAYSENVKAGQNTKYDISATAEHGTILVTDSDGNEINKASSGEIVKVKAESYIGYKVKDVLINGESMKYTVKSNANTFVMPCADATLKVVYESSTQDNITKIDFSDYSPYIRRIRGTNGVLNGDTLGSTQNSPIFSLGPADISGLVKITLNAATNTYAYTANVYALDEETTNPDIVTAGTKIADIVLTATGSWEIKEDFEGSVTSADGIKYLYLSLPGNGWRGNFYNMRFEYSDELWSGLNFDWEKPAEPGTYDTTPIGNGLFGARVTGGVSEDIYHLTSMRFWSGGVYDDYDESGQRKAALEQTRADLLNGNIDEAEKNVKQIAGNTIDVGTPLPLGDIKINFADIDSYSGYSRVLDIDKAMLTTQYTYDSETYIRESFVSLPDNVMVVKYATKDGTPMSFDVSMNYREEMEGYNASVSIEGDDTITMWCTAPSAVTRTNTDWTDFEKGTRAFAELKVIPENGTVKSDGTLLKVTDADSVIILYSCDTSYVDGLTSPEYVKNTVTDPEPGVRQSIIDAAKKSYSELLRNHLQDYRSLFRTMYLEVNGNHTLDYIKAFQYARYEMIASSRDVTLVRADVEIPNDRFHHQYAGWNISWEPQSYSAHFLNENVQKFMGSVETTNISSVAEPLMRWIKELSENGAKTAEYDFGFRGWMAPHYSDAWASTALKFGSSSIANEWGMWPMGGVWLCNNMWDNYDFSRDMDRAEEYYEILRGASLFCLDYLQYDPDTGCFATSPSTSPETQHMASLQGEEDTSGKHYALDKGSTADLALIRELFKNTIKLAYITDQYNSDTEFISEIEEMTQKLLPYQIGTRGDLQQYSKDYNDWYQNHRHASETLAVWPLSSIDNHETPMLNAAAVQGLALRNSGGYHPDRNAMWARLGEAERFDLASYTGKPNSNSGVGGMWGSNLVSGFPELIVRSDNGYIELLPSLPSAMSNGKAYGIRARGNYTIDIEWENGELINAHIDSPDGVMPRIMYKNEFIDKNDSRITFELGETNIDKVKADAKALLAENYTAESKQMLQTAINSGDAEKIEDAVNALVLQKPQFTNADTYEVKTGQELVINISAFVETRPQQKFVYYIKDMPEYSTLEEFTGELRWTPVNKQAGENVLTVMVNDGVSENTQNITVDVTVDENYVDKEELKEETKTAKDIDTRYYSDATVNKLNNAILTAESVIDNPNATKEDVAEALNALKTAVAGLKEGNFELSSETYEFEQASYIWGDNKVQTSIVDNTKKGTVFAFDDIALDDMTGININMSTQNNTIVLGVYASDAEVSAGSTPNLSDDDKIAEITATPTGSWTTFEEFESETNALNGTKRVFVKVLSTSGSWGGNYDSITFNYKHKLSEKTSILCDGEKIEVLPEGKHTFSGRIETEADGNLVLAIYESGVLQQVKLCNNNVDGIYTTEETEYTVSDSTDIALYFWDSNQKPIAEPVKLKAGTPVQINSYWGDNGDGTFTNPVLPMDYSDPDVIRVDDDFYMVSSTFMDYPGTTVLHSTDLVNWETVGYAIENPAEFNSHYSYDKMDWYGNGVYAPSIRYHNGTFYVYSPVYNTGGILVSTATNPEGPWTTQFVKDKNGNDIKVERLTDLCPLWDYENNCAYMLLSNLASTNYGIDVVLDGNTNTGHAAQLFKMSLDGKTLLDCDATDGASFANSGVVIRNILGSEGNKLYIKDGYYYIFNCDFQGKSNDGAGPYIRRAKNIYGDVSAEDDSAFDYENDGAVANGEYTYHHGGYYERCYLGRNAILQGGFVDTPDGKWYFMGQTGKYTNSGREPWLVEVTWNEGEFPFMDKTPTETSKVLAKPIESSIAKYTVSGDDFNDEALAINWNWNHQPNSEWYELKDGSLRLLAQKRLSGSFWGTRNVINQKYVNTEYVDASTKLDLSGMAEGQEAGITHFNGGTEYITLGVYMNNGEKYVSLDVNGKITESITEYEGDEIYFRTIVDKDKTAHMYYSADNETWVKAGSAELPVADSHYYKGDRIGLYTYNDTSNGGYVDFDYFNYDFTGPAWLGDIPELPSSTNMEIRGDYVYEDVLEFENMLNGTDESGIISGTKQAKIGEDANVSNGKLIGEIKNGDVMYIGDFDADHLEKMIVRASSMRTDAQIEVYAVDKTAITGDVTKENLSKWISGGTLICSSDIRNTGSFNVFKDNYIDVTDIELTDEYALFVKFISSGDNWVANFDNITLCYSDFPFELQTEKVYFKDILNIAWTNQANSDGTYIGSTKKNDMFNLGIHSLDNVVQININATLMNNTAEMTLYRIDKDTDISEMTSSELNSMLNDSIAVIPIAKTANWNAESYCDNIVNVKGLSGEYRIIGKITSASGSWGGNYNYIEFYNTAE